MKKLRLLLTIFMALFIGLAGANINVKADTATKLVVHYHRFDPNYSPWEMWLWQYTPSPGEGSTHKFNGDDEFGKVYEIELAGTALDGATQVGIIIKTASWEKDVSTDRYISMANPNAQGEVHAYFVSGDPTIYYTSDGIDISNRVLQADFTKIDEIKFTASSNVTENDIQVLADGTPQAIDSFNMINGEATITLANDADLGKIYTLEVDFGDPGVDPKESTIGFAGLYSSDAFNNQYAYDGELGTIYSTSETTFKLWAPLSSNVVLNLFTAGHTALQTDYQGNAGVDVAYETHNLVKGDKGVWEVTVPGDLHGIYYTYSVTNGSVTNEASDPYAFASGVNGKRSMVVNFDLLDPENWVDGYRPDTIESYNDSIITEVHVRDYTAHSTWNGTESLRGTFLGLAESGTTLSGVSTGFDHIVELGVTHVQLLPVFDYGAAVDETRLKDPDYIGKKDTIFNWGYMPENFNVVEGSYATDPYNGTVRIEEYKQLIQAFSDNDIRVVMDVVYNHHGKSADSNFDLIVPGYYFRFNDNGSFSNGSGTGNETASEHYMMSKFMVDSVMFWAEEYNISGFRFDLMKLHDVDTMNAISTALHEIDPTILIYGEPWNGGTSPLSDSIAAYNANLDQMPGVAVFNDDTRDGIKGSVFNEEEQGFIQGVSSSATDERIKLGIVGAVQHTQIAVASLPKGAWALNPNQTVNYATAHDNNVLFDKIMLSTSGLTYDEIKAMQMQANAIVLTSNGIPFLHGGVEIMRSKPCTVISGEAQGECDSTLKYDHNSYRSPDQTNAIDWTWKVDNMDVFEYYKGLIEIRRSVDVFSYDSKEDLQSHLFFLQDPSGMVSYIVYDETSPWEYTLVAHNNAVVDRPLDLQGYTWNLVANKDTAGLNTISEVEGTYTMAPNETVIMYVKNANVVFVPDVLQSIFTDVITTEYNNKNMLDLDAIIQEIKDELHKDAVVEINEDIDYKIAGDYKLQVIVTDQFGSVTNYSPSITVTEPVSSNLGIIIGSIIGGIALLGTGVLFFLRKG